MTELLLGGCLGANQSLSRSLARLPWARWPWPLVPVKDQPSCCLRRCRGTSPSRPRRRQCESDFGIACYTPAQYEQAYGTNQLYSHGVTGAGETIVLVDSFGSPTIQNDLAEFDAETCLPAPPSFKVIPALDGPIPPYDPNNSDMGGWAIETSLDVEMAHEMAPGARPRTRRDTGQRDRGHHRPAADDDRQSGTW